MKKRLLDRSSAAARRPPAFQEYASDLMAQERVKLMSLEERGLFASLRWYLWANDSIPRDPEQMARLLGLEAQVVRAALTERVLSFFHPAQGDAQRLICGELAGQMRDLIERREKQAQAGRDTAKARRYKNFSALGDRDGERVAERGVERVAPEMRRDEMRREELAYKRGDSSKQEQEDEVIEMQRAFGERP